MNRRAFGRGLAAAGAGALVGDAARGQDLGKFFERAAKDTFNRAVSPENLGRSVEKALTPRPADAAEPLPFRTADGWTLVAHRYRPAAGPGGGPPLVLCHGLTYSAAFWDLDPSVSLARYLARRGFDVWAIDLRGCGASQKWVFRLEDAPTVMIGGMLRRVTGGKMAPTGYATMDPKSSTWTLDDHIAYDVPAAVRFVRQQTGAAEVSWLGHSMGGIVALAHLTRFQNPGIGRLACVGSQLTMQNAQLVLPFLQQMLLARQTQLAGKLTPTELAGMTQQSVQNLFFNVEHVSPQVYQALGPEHTDIPALGLMKQYMTLTTKGELFDAKGQFSYTQNAANIQVPVFISCGELDQFAPPPVQKTLHDRVGSADRTLRIFGRRYGFAADSGHDDALVGLTSAAQVYPILDAWLRRPPAA
jgi:pimeloyl-ACP methyl ester carboxylesterase